MFWANWSLYFRIKGEKKQIAKAKKKIKWTNRFKRKIRPAWIKGLRAPKPGPGQAAPRATQQRNQKVALRALNPIYIDHVAATAIIAPKAYHSKGSNPAIRCPIKTSTNNISRSASFIYFMISSGGRLVFLKHFQAATYRFCKRLSVAHEFLLLLQSVGANTFPRQTCHNYRLLSFVLNTNRLVVRLSFHFLCGNAGVIGVFFGWNW